MLQKIYSVIKKSWAKIVFIALGLGSLIWFLIRVVPKPSRAAYPCMKATVPVASSFVTYILGITSATLLFKKARERMMKSKFLIASLFIMLGFAAGYIALTNSTSDILAIDYQGPQAGNEPIGQGKGIFPGRVVWVHDADATDADCPNSGGEYWYEDDYTDGAVIQNMLSQGLQQLTGATTDAAAWDSIFHYHNRKHGNGNVGYTAGEKIVIKINMNAIWNGDDGINTSPHVSYAVLDQLINTAGVAQADIGIGDPNCGMVSGTYEKCHATFPNVIYWRANGAASPASTTNEVIHGSDGSFDNQLPQAYVDAKYMINLPVFKKHHRAGISICAKNHFGSIAAYSGGAWHLHPSLPVPDANEEGQEPNTEYGIYRCFVDIMGHEDLGGKTILYLVDGIWSSVNWGHPPIKWRMAPFNNDYPNSLFLSQDPVAIESVCYDFLYEEFDEDHPTEGIPATSDKGPFSRFPAADDFLHQAADPANWPIGINYDPEDDGSVLTSLGTHEHWNNATDKLYTRNLGTGYGIELISDYTPVAVNHIVAPKRGTIENYPNPFRNQTTINYTLSATSNVQLTIYSVSGAIVHQRNLGQQTSGQQEYSWDASGLTPGQYLCTISGKGSAGEFKLTGKMNLIK
ncbi:MAG: DUF362 domain-containing protein [Bacteroidales bacterium]|nr:DUF362 domain-containing protein [Bacteroidales bacterium]